MFKTSRLVLVKVSLFNLQGTRSVRRSIDYYSTTSPLCQALFLTFFLFFRLWLLPTTKPVSHPSPLYIPTRKLAVNGQLYALL